MKMKLCLWFAPDGRVVKRSYVPQTEMSLPEPGLPVLIVAFDENGFEQADIYHVDGAMIGVGSDRSYWVRDPNGNTEFVEPA